MTLLGRRAPLPPLTEQHQVILAAIEAEPGISMSALRRLTGLTWGQTSNRVTGLIDRDLIHLMQEPRAIAADYINTYYPGPEVQP